MKPFWLRSDWLLVAAFVLLSPLADQAEQTPAADEIIRRAVERAKRVEEEEVEAGYAFRQHVVTEKLDANGNVKSRDLRLYEAIPIEGLHYARLLEKDGQPLAGEEVKKEQEREKKFRAEIAEIRQRRKQNPDRVRFNEELVSRYRWELASEEVVNDRPTFVLSFEPKSKDLPVKRRIDRMLNKMAGKLWVDKQEYEVVKVEARLLERVTMWGGLIASISDFTLTFEQTRVDDGVWLPYRLSQYIKGRFFFSSIHQRSQQQASDFQKAAPELAGAKNQP